MSYGTFKFYPHVPRLDVCLDILQPPCYVINVARHRLPRVLQESLAVLDLSADIFVAGVGANYTQTDLEPHYVIQMGSEDADQVLRELKAASGVIVTSTIS